MMCRGFSIGLLAASLIVGAACGEDEENGGGSTDADTDGDTDTDIDTDTDTDSDGDVVFQELRADLERETAPDATSEELSSMRNGNVNLGLDLYHGLASENDDNLALSPFSMRSAFAMLQAAAVGQTATEIGEVMGFLPDQERLHTAMNSLDLALRSRNLPEQGDLEPVQLRTANRVFTRLDRPMGDDYLETMAVHYGAGVFLADFAGDPEGERVKINTWVEQQTNNRIKDLIPENNIKPDTAWVLVNALYFKAPWMMKFATDMTFEQAFNRIDNSKVNAPTMHSLPLHISYAKGDGYKVIDMPLRGGDLTVTLILPDSGKFKEIESGLTRDSLDTMLAGMQEGLVEVALPKFEIDTGSMDFRQMLIDLGMTTPFSNGADFSGFGPNLPPSKIDFVFQSVFVAADEAGVEAAAATAIGGVDTSAPEIDLVFDAHRPFVFLIRDIPTGLVLFIGRVMDPTA